MKTALPSGVWMSPVPVVRLNVRVEPTSVPLVQTMPIFGALVGRAPAGIWDIRPATTAKHAPTASAGFTIRLRSLDIGLTHLRLRGKWRAAVHADLGLHAAVAGRPVVR